MYNIIYIYIYDICNVYDIDIYIYIDIPIYLAQISSSSKSPRAARTPLDAHRDGSMSAPSFRINYNTRDELWPAMFQNTIVPVKTADPLTT